MPRPDSLRVRILYCHAAPGELFHWLRLQRGAVFRNGIHSACLVIWMMMSPRWQSGGMLAGSVQQLA
jgi:hypothetical protein